MVNMSHVFTAQKNAQIQCRISAPNLLDLRQSQISKRYGNNLWMAMRIPKLCLPTFNKEK